MNLENMHNNFINGDIDKPEFIDIMYKHFLILADYSNYIKNTEVKSINIGDDFIIMELRNGIKMYCNFQDKTGMPQYSINVGYYEKEEKDMILKLVNDNDIIFDIGANNGYYSLCLANKFKNVQIYSFEPMPEVFNYFSKNIKVNNFNNIFAYNLGMWHENSELDFHYYSDYTVGTSIGDLFDRDDSNIIKVKVKKLDDFVQENNITKIDFIKCDIEGAELFALKGGENIIKESKPILFVEMLRKWSAKFDYTPNDIMDFLSSIGYKCYYINNNKLKILESMNDTVSETNFFFLHDKKHQELIMDYTE